jgi:hypothetical protein
MVHQDVEDCPNRETRSVVGRRGGLSEVCPKTRCYPDDWQHREKKTEIDHLPQAKKCTEIIAHCSERDN